MRTARAKKHAVENMVQDQIDAHLPQIVDNIADIIDIAHLANPDNLEQLLHLAESLSDPISLDLDDELRTWKEAKESADAIEWEKAYKEELQLLKTMGVWKLIPRSDVSTDQKIQKGCPVFKIKHDKNGKAVQFKVHLVFKGYEQIYGRDYTKTTSPMARMESWCVLLHLAATKGWDATQIDVKTTFLYGLFPDDKVQYMQQPKGFEE